MGSEKERSIWPDVLVRKCAPVMMHAVVSLLEMEGTLAMSNCHMGASKVDLWFLQDLLV